MDEVTCERCGSEVANPARSGTVCGPCLEDRPENPEFPENAPGGYFWGSVLLSGLGLLWVLGVPFALPNAGPNGGGIGTLWMVASCGTGLALLAWVNGLVVSVVQATKLGASIAPKASAGVHLILFSLAMLLCLLTGILTS